MGCLKVVGFGAESENPSVLKCSTVFTASRKIASTTAATAIIGLGLTDKCK